MNKINSKIASLFICLSLVSLYGCSSGLEGEAKKQMEETMKELAKDPSSIQITNVETVFSNDSICILHFKFSGKNGFGGVSSDDMEYIYITFHDNNNEQKTKETVFKLEETESILKKARDSYRKKTWDNPNNKKLSEEDRKAWYIHFEANLYMILGGREVGKSKSSKYDTDKW